MVSKQVALTDRFAFFSGMLAMLASGTLLCGRGDVSCIKACKPRTTSPQALLASLNLYLLQGPLTPYPTLNFSSPGAGLLFPSQLPTIQSSHFGCASLLTWAVPLGWQLPPPIWLKVMSTLDSLRCHCL